MHGNLWRYIFGIALGLSIFSEARSEVSIDGAGATFPYPVYARWAEAYRAKTGVEIAYRPVGSAGGVRQVVAKLVDFGASDMPLMPARLDKDDLVQFPLVVGGVVPIVNLEGIPDGALRLDGEALAGIYLGRIARWNDPVLLELNPGLKLPDAKIEPVHFADGSGTTFILSRYLSGVSREWKRVVGEGASVPWPIGAGAKGSEAMVDYVQRTKNSIGYVQYAYIRNVRGVSPVRMRGRDGRFVVCGEASIRAAAMHARWEGRDGAPEMHMGDGGVEDWPISGASYILMRAEQSDPEVARELLRFFEWTASGGSRLASELGYAELPEGVRARVRQLWKEEMRGRNGAPLLR